jgi:hypothetical protein
VSERTEGVAAALGGAEDPLEHRGHDHRLGDPLADDGVDPRCRVEAREKHGPAPAVKRAQDRRHPGDVVRRNADELRFVVTCAKELDALDDVRSEMTVAQHGDLGIAGGATREQHHRDGVGINISDRLGGVVRVVCNLTEELFARDELDALDVGDPSDAVRADDDEPGCEPRDDSRESVIGESVVHGCKRSPEARGAEECDRHRVRVEIEQTDVLDVACGEDLCGSSRSLQQLAGGERARHCADDGTVGRGLRHHLEQHRDVHR